MDVAGDHLHAIKYLLELKSKGILVDIIDHYLTVIEYYYEKMINLLNFQ